MKTSYFTFGFDHKHDVNGRRFDKDVIVKITDDDPRDVMFSYFGNEWAFDYPPEQVEGEGGLLQRYSYEVVELSRKKTTMRELALDGRSEYMAIVYVGDQIGRLVDALGDVLGDDSHLDRLARATRDVADGQGAR